MTRAEAFSKRGVAIIEYALTSDDVDRMAEAFGVSPAPAVWSWIEGHEGLRRLAAELIGEPSVCCAMSTSGPIVDPPTWLADWQTVGTEWTTRTVHLIVHLDAVDEMAGPLEVAVGTHRGDMAPPSDAVLCLCAPGDILALHPDVRVRRQRPAKCREVRTLHLSYAAADRSRTGAAAGNPHSNRVS